MPVCVLGRLRSRKMGTGVKTSVGVRVGAGGFFPCKRGGNRDAASSSPLGGMESGVCAGQPDLGLGVVRALALEAY